MQDGGHSLTIDLYTVSELVAPVCVCVCFLFALFPLLRCGFTLRRYIALTVNTFKNQGQQPPDLEFIRQHYRQQKMSLGMM